MRTKNRQKWNLESSRRSVSSLIFARTPADSNFPEIKRARISYITKLLVISEPRNSTYVTLLIDPWYKEYVT
jgi:hypothetical protein